MSKVCVCWGGDAHGVYDTGFMHGLRKAPDGGVCLFNMDLIENDAPGAGHSEKGVSSDIVWGSHCARKILALDDPRAEKVWLVIFVRNGWSNPNPLKYPLRFSVNGHTGAVEPWDRPEFEQLRARENLDGVTAGSKTQFEAMVKLCEYATFRVGRKYGTPLPDYPGWDAVSILNRVDQHGSLGMCIQFNNFLVGLCMVYGWQGRLVNGMNHEMAEVWSDDFGKWVYLESSYGNHHMIDRTTGEPLGLLELHKAHLDYFFPDRSIDWMNDLTNGPHTLKVIEERGIPPPVCRSSTTYHKNHYLPYEGMQLASFLRLVPRNNFYEKPLPLPLTHGCVWWPWNGYINWYDERTPPQRQYSRFTDRPRDLWPDLNLVHVDATSGHSNKFLFLRFETYTPNFSHFEVDENDSGWRRLDSNRWTWVLATGRNTLRVRAVNRRGARGKSSAFAVNRADVPLKDLYA